MAADRNDYGISERRGGGWRSLGAAGSGVARKALGPKGRAFAAFVSDWPAIVGEELARHCLPLSLRFPKTGERREATLTLRVESGAWATELDHRKGEILERINGYFGYGAVARLRFRSGPLPRPREEVGKLPAKPPRRITEDEEKRLRESLTEIESEELRQALARLGRRLLARR